MATFIKEHHFAIDLESFVASVAVGGVNARWYPPHKSRGHANPNYRGYFRDSGLLGTMGGCLATTAPKNMASSENYYERTCTWEDLGVTPGFIVTNIQADYIWRIDLKAKKAGYNSDAVWSASGGGNPVGAGPFELRDSGGTLIDTFSARQYAPARASGGDHGYPLGSQVDLVSFTPPSWAHVIGSNIAVPAPQQASGSTIKLRLRNLTPATDPFAGSGTWVKLKQDYVKLTITASAAPTGNFWPVIL